MKVLKVDGKEEDNMLGKKAAIITDLTHGMVNAIVKPFLINGTKELDKLTTLPITSIDRTSDVDEK